MLGNGDAGKAGRSGRLEVIVIGGDIQPGLGAVGHLGSGRRLGHDDGDTARCREIIVFDDTLLDLELAVLDVIGAWCQPDLGASLDLDATIIDARLKQLVDA